MTERMLICRFCALTAAEGTADNPFIYRNGIALCLNCIGASLEVLHDHMAGEIEYRSWFAPSFDSCIFP